MYWFLEIRLWKFLGRDWCLENTVHLWGPLMGISHCKIDFWVFPKHNFLSYQVLALILITLPVYFKVNLLLTSWPIIGGIIAAGVFLLLIAIAGIYGSWRQHQIILFFVSFVISNVPYPEKMEHISYVCVLCTSSWISARWVRRNMRSFTRRNAREVWLHGGDCPCPLENGLNTVTSFSCCFPLSKCALSSIPVSNIYCTYEEHIRCFWSFI